MKGKIAYISENAFIFECATCDILPKIHWCEDEIGVSGFIWFELDNQVHLFRSDSKKVLDAIWNSIGLVRHALKLVEKAKS